MKAKDLVGKTVGRLTILSVESRNGISFLKCDCSCGTQVTVGYGHVRCGDTQSCGCLKRERTSKAKFIHGMSHSILHQKWCRMRYRCESPKDPEWKNYGGRGIKVCKRWQSFKKFLEDTGASYDAHVAIHGAENTTLERKNVNGNYTPSNCRWATWKEQASNQRRTILFHGETASSAASRLDMRPAAVTKRLKRGWSTEDAFSKPKVPRLTWKNRTRVGKKNKSGTLGVYKISDPKRRKRWVARIDSDNKRLLNRYFLTKQEAVNAITQFKKENL